MTLVGLALVIKGCLTIVTFGIKLPGTLSLEKKADGKLESLFHHWLLVHVSVELWAWRWSGLNLLIRI
jgi:hypothetical protein